MKKINMFRSRKKIDFEKGKKLFFECCGSSMCLDRDYGAEYKKCNIPKEIEEQWRAEIKIEIENRIQYDEGAGKVSAISKLLQICDLNERLDILYCVLKCDNLDTFSRIILCEFLQKERKHCNGDQIIGNIIATNKEKLLKNEIVIHESYRNAAYMKGYNFSEESIKKRIENLY